MRTMVTRGLGGAAAATALALTLGACGGERQRRRRAGGEVRLLTPIFEGASGKQVLEEELLPQFYEEHPDVKVTVDYTDYGSLNEKLTTSIASGLTPGRDDDGGGLDRGFRRQGRPPGSR